MEALYRADKLAQLAARVERHLPRQANDAIAMEASGLFIQEFIRGRSGAYGNLQGELLWGVWPKHPYDDSVERLRDALARSYAPGGALHSAVESAVDIAEDFLSQDGESPCGQEVLVRAAAKKAVRDAFAEALGGTACAWAHDAHWTAADFASITRMFEEESARIVERQGYGAAMPLDACGGVECCLDLAAFLFSTHYAVAPCTPAQEEPFVWSKESYQGFTASLLGECPDQSTMQAFVQEVPHALLEPVPADALLHPCLFRDPFALALDLAETCAPGVSARFLQGFRAGSFQNENDAARAMFHEAFRVAHAAGAVGPLDNLSLKLGGEGSDCSLLMRSLSLLTLACCIGTGREDPRAYIKLRLGVEI